MLSVFQRIFGIDEDVMIIQIYNNIDVEEVRKEVIHESLESSRSIGQALRHDKPLKRAVASSERGFLLIAVSNPNEVIGMLEVNFSEDLRTPTGVQKVGNEGKWILVLPGNVI
jgi:hypothetical protein